MHVIATVGLPGSGKGEFANVAREAGVPVVTMGDVIREECRERGLDPETHHGDVARALREEEGPAAIAERTIPAVEDHVESGAEVVLIDGVRSDAEVERFEAAFGKDFSLVSVEAPFETRAERLRERGRDESDLDHESLRAREERELGFGMGEAMAMADVTVENTDSLAAFRRRVRAILEAPAAAHEGETVRDGPEPGEESGTGAHDG